MYKGGCIFVDHASGFVFVVMQVNLTTADTLMAKEAFEKFALDHGVVPQQYRTDHGSAFTSAEYSRHLARFQQVHTLAGPGAHHQNGVAERAIGVVLLSLIHI